MILWVLVIQISRRCRHWAVDIYRNIRNPAFGHQSMEVIQEQLRSPDSKRRDKDHTAVFECLINNALKIGSRVGLRMVSRPVCRFHEENVRSLKRNRRTENKMFTPAQISRKDYRFSLLVAANINLRNSRAQQVAGISKSNRDTITQDN